MYVAKASSRDRCCLNFINPNQSSARDRHYQNLTVTSVSFSPTNANYPYPLSLINPEK
jgi:hypothetical protein